MNIVDKIQYFENKKVDHGMVTQCQIESLVTHLLEIVENDIEGDVVELGCFVGESSKYLTKTLVETNSTKKMYVYDSFEGLPPLSKWEEGTAWKPGTFDTTEEILIQNFKQNSLPPPIITKGWFKDIPDDRLPEKISMAFLDGDFYDSIYDSLHKVYDRVSEGGYILFHDYQRPDLPGVEQAIVDFFEERDEIFTITKVCPQLGVIQKKEYKKPYLNEPITKQPTIEVNQLPSSPPNNYTIVSGLWNLSRDGREFKNHYLANFEQFLKIDSPMILFIPKYLEEFVRARRSDVNTFIKICELSDIKSLYSPHWNKTQEIRTSENWINITGENGWLTNSPQCKLEYYNPIVMSKMSMLNESVCFNPFETDYFFWLDAGITNTVNSTDLIEGKVLDKLPELGNPFLFLSYPYKNYEIHGFKTSEIVKLIGKETEYVCRGGLFGGHADQIREANSTYYHLLSDTLNAGNMGTEETIFTIMAYLQPLIYQRYKINSGGFIQNFIDDIKEGKAEPVITPKSEINYEIIGKRDLVNIKTNLYVLTFNFPKQLIHTINSMKKTPEWLEHPSLYLLDNSTDSDAKLKNKIIAQDHNFEYIDLGGNTGICGGRQAAAEHFDQSDADFMFFFEDDMTSNPSELEGEFCRNGFRKYVPDLYLLVHKIMLKEKYDFLKLSFTEVYLDNDMQTSWYNVPQNVRDKYWPDYNALPIHGLDPHSPKTKFNNIKNMDGLGYIDGEIYYANWPMIASKEGNRKMFIDVKWSNPFEQTWMSYIFQETKKGTIKPAVLLASPIWHDRIQHYKAADRREN